jgi:acetolactate synthase I/II/III large subunit
MTGERATKAGYAATEVLARAGVRRAYTVPGESFLEILDAVERHPEMTLVSTRHESGASFMAEADAKLTGVPAVAMATRGVGASNLAIGVHTARQDSTPMLVLLGQVESQHLGKEAFQGVDLPNFYSEITKWSATVNRADRLPEFIAKALRIAASGRPGPVMLALPADLLGEEIPAHEAGSRSASPVPPMPGDEDVKKIRRLVSEARRPVVIAGGGARDARAELVSFAETFDVGVYTGFRRQDRFPNDHPNYLGHLALGTPPQVLKALEGADLVLVAGCRLGEVTTQGYKLPRRDQKVVQVDIDPGEIGAVVPVALGVAADARATLAALNDDAPSPGPDRDWAGARGAYLETSGSPAGRSEAGIDPAEVVAAMRETLPRDAILTNDAGNFSAFLHRHWSYDHPLTQLAPTNGAMGYGVPAAVAAKLAAPERCVVAVAGDGGFLMSGQEIETAVRYGASILVVVFRNGIHGTIAMHQAKEMGRSAGIEISDVDLASYARSLGALGYTVETPDELSPALEEALVSGSTALLDVVTDPDVISPFARLSELMPYA